jgi:HK97 family phage prohead protease
MTNIAVRGAVLRRPADGSRVITFRASTPRVDRHGTKILSEGIDTTEFDRNPIFAWGHDAVGGGIFGGAPDMDHVIGRVVSHSKTAQAFDIDVEFVPAEVNAKAERAFQLVKKGFLNAVSIGFIPMKWHDEGEDSGRGAMRIYDAVSLLEVSLVPVPSNADCVAIARSYCGESKRSFDLDELEALETIHRAGAVLNRANKAKLTQAAALVNEVLATAAKEESSEEDPARIATHVTITAPTGTGLTEETRDGVHTIEVRAPEAEEDDDQEDDGVYIARPVRSEDAKRLAKWAKERGIKDVVDPEDMHVTVVYSRADFAADELGDDDEEVSVKVKGIKRLKEAIVLTLDAPKIVARHKAAREKGASHDFKSYQPHISLSYSGPDSDLPDDFPAMSVRLGPEFRETIKDIADRSAPPALNAADIGAAAQAAIRAYLTETAISQGIKRALQAA